MTDHARVSREQKPTCSTFTSWSLRAETGVPLGCPWGREGTAPALSTGSELSPQQDPHRAQQSLDLLPWPWRLVGQTGKGIPHRTTRGLGAHPSPESRSQPRLTLKVVSLQTLGLRGSRFLLTNRDSVDSSPPRGTDLLLEPPGQFWSPCLTRCGGRTPGACTGQIHSCWEQQLQTRVPCPALGATASWEDHG